MSKLVIIPYHKFGEKLGFLLDKFWQIVFEKCFERYKPQYNLNHYKKLFNWIENLKYQCRKDVSYFNFILELKKYPYPIPMKILSGLNIRQMF